MLSSTLAALATLIPSPVRTALEQAHATHGGGEANLILPDLSTAQFVGFDGRTLLMGGLAVCVLGLVFGLVIYGQLKKMPVHKSMLEISELIYETCKTYLVTQGKFILMLWVFIGTIMVVYFGALRHMEAAKVVTIVVFSLIGIGGGYGLAWVGIRPKTFPQSPPALAGPQGKPFPCYPLPPKARTSIGILLISR